MKRFIGLRNIVTFKTPIEEERHWKYLMLYEVDNHEEHDCLQIISIFSRMETSFVCYKTKNGFHFVGLTPIDSDVWGIMFKRLQLTCPEYFSGETLRISLKENEKQELIHYSFRYPYLERLASIYIERFSIPKDKVPIYGEPPNYNCVFEKYWSVKI